MKLEKGVISSSQLMLLMLSFLQSMHLTIGFAYVSTKHDIWLAVLAGFIITIFFALIYIAIAQKFPQKTLIEINDAVYGPYFGKLISAIYVWFFFQLIMPNLYLFNSYWIRYIMPNTPRAVIMGMFIFVSAMAVRKGIEVIVRCSFLFVVITAVSVLTVTVLLLKDMNFRNLLPIFDLTVKDFIHGVHIIVAIPFCEIIVFLMVIPYTNKSGQVKRSVLLAILLGAIQLLIIVVRDTVVLGTLNVTIISPSFEATRQVNISNVLTRLDILLALVLFITIFVKVTVFYYASVLGMAQLLHFRSYLPLVTPIGILSVALSTQLFNSDMEQYYFGANIWPFYPIPYEFLIPIITLIVARIRKLPKKQKGEAA